MWTPRASDTWPSVAQKQNALYTCVSSCSDTLSGTGPSYQSSASLRSGPSAMAIASNLLDHLRGVSEHPRTRRHRARHERAGLDEGAFADRHALQDRGVRPDIDSVTDLYRRHRH